MVKVNHIIAKAMSGVDVSFSNLKGDRVLVSYDCLDLSFCVDVVGVGGVGTMFLYLLASDADMLNCRNKINQLITKS